MSEHRWESERAMISEFGAADPGDTYDTLCDARESGRRSWCQGAVQEIKLVPKTEVGKMQS